MKKFLLSAFLLLFPFTALAADEFRGGEFVTNPFRKMDVMVGGFTSHTINQSAANDWIEFILTAPEAATITTLKFVYGTRAATPVEHKIGIEGVSATTGQADGVYATGTGECSASFTPPADTSWNGTVRTVTLTGTTCALTRGQKFAITIRPVGTPDGTNNSSFAYRQSALGGSAATGWSDYSIIYDGGTASRQGFYWPMIAYGNGSRMFGFPLSGYNTPAYNVDSTPDEPALRFQLPLPTGCTTTIAGVTVIAKIPNGSKSIIANLYDGTTAIATGTVDTDQVAGGNGTWGGSQGNMAFFRFTTEPLPELSPNTTYRIGIQPQTASMNMEIEDFVVSSNDDFDAWPLGKQTYFSARTDAGAWTDTTTKRPGINLLLGTITCSSGSNSTSNLNPNLN